MKKRKLGLILNIATLCLSIAAIAIGVYSITTASLTINGSVGFTVHECRVNISGYMYGYADTASGPAHKKPTTDAEKQYLTYDGSKKATDEDPMIVASNNQSLSFNIGEGNGVYFSSEVFDNEIKPIVIVLRVANATENMILVEDTTTVSSDAKYKLNCDNQANMLYAQGDGLSTTITYTLLPKKDSSGNYVAITNSVAVNLSLSFSKFENNIASTGFTFSGTSITGVPATQNVGTDLLIIPSKFSDSATVYTSLGYNSKALKYADNYRKVIVLDGIKKINDKAFYRCGGIRSIAIPNSVTTIGASAFDNCVGLTSITIPNGVTTIESGTFSECYDLTSITIPNSVITIGGQAFNRCGSLTSITIPSSVTTIGDTAFLGCKSLTSITIPSSVTTIERNTFRNCTSLTSITIPNSVTTINYSAFSGCAGLKSITIPNGVTTIYEYTFDKCTSLTSITIPNSVTTIRHSAFSGCGSLTSITIPSSVTTIGDTAFNGCSSLTSITIPNGVTAISYDTFSGCSSLTSITIPNGVTAICANVFNGCSSLTSIIIPSSVKKIEHNVFSGCTKLSSIRFEKTDNWQYSTDHGKGYTDLTSSMTLTDAGKNATNFKGDWVDYWFKQK